MGVDDFDFISNFSTLWQVVLGAGLATLGGFAATQMERMVLRRERQRNASLLIGELIATIAIVLDLAKDARTRGEPYGPVTMRLLRSARRELDIYERNRERLADLEDGALRARVHQLMIRLSIGLEGIFDTAREIAELRLQRAHEAICSEAETRLSELREQGFEFMVETAGTIPDLLKQFEPLAGHRFGEVSQVARESRRAESAA